MTVTALGRSEIEWPDLGTAGGAALETAIHNAVTKISDDSITRYKANITLNNGQSTQYVHNFDLPSSDIEVILTATDTGARFTEDGADNGLIVQHPDQNTVEITNTAFGLSFNLLIIGKSTLRSVGQTRRYSETTDATETAIASRTIPNGSAEMLVATINGHNQTSGNSASMELKYKVKNNSNTLTLTLIEKTVNKDVASWDANMTNSGNLVLVNVVGEAGLVRWNCVLRNTKL